MWSSINMLTFCWGLIVLSFKRLSTLIIICPIRCSKSASINFSFDNTLIPDAGVRGGSHTMTAAQQQGVRNALSYISGVTGILNSYVSGLANTTVGGVTWDPTKHCTSFGPGAYIVPAYKTGAPRGYSLVFGAGGAFRTYGEMTALPIEMKQDYDFVQGFGYESVWGQGARVDTKGYPRHYMLIEQCIQREGIPVPGN